MLGADSEPAALPETAKQPVLEAPPAVGEPASVLATSPEPAHDTKQSPAEPVAGGLEPAAVEPAAAAEKVLQQDAAMADAEVRPCSSYFTCMKSNCTCPKWET